MKFIHITDTHLVPLGETLCALDPASRLNSIVDEINRLHADAAFVVHTGDLPYHGLEPVYRAMREISTSTLPGINHQIALYLGEDMTMIDSHEANAYGVCLIDDDYVVVHFQDPLDRSARFVLTDPRSKQTPTAAALIAPPQAFNDAL